MVSLIEACNEVLEWLTEAKDACQKVALIVTYVVLRAGLVPGRRPFRFFMSIFWRTRAVVVVHPGVGGKVTAAGFPDPRGGPGFRRAGDVVVS